LRLVIHVLAVIFRPRLQSVDDAGTVPQRELELLASVPFFEPLAPTLFEKLAMRVRPLAIAAGIELIREGGGRQSLLPHRFWVRSM
jgi:hypothetical protein